MNELVVSIKCMVYNHEKYLKQCLDGFIMQKTNFRFEAIVHDDASTDNSALIIKEYADKYPNIIKPIFEKENQYSKNDGSLRKIIDERLDGKYIAFCEGDDYWTDPYKLQKQVDFMETHPDYSICTHHYKKYYQEDDTFGNLEPDIASNYTFDMNDFINSWLTQPLTLLYRNSCYNPDEYYKYKNSKDLTLGYYFLKKGKGFLMEDCMGVYRIHENGVCSGASSYQNIINSFITIFGLYEVEKNEIVAKYLYNFTKGIGYLKFDFFKQHWNSYKKAIEIVYKHLGLKAILKILMYNFVNNKILERCYSYIKK